MRCCYHGYPLTQGSFSWIRRSFYPLRTRSISLLFPFGARRCCRLPFIAIPNGPYYLALCVRTEVADLDTRADATRLLSCA
jgi:hypothetical protein